MSIAEKLQTIAENEQRVYEAGKAYGETVGSKAQYDEFWDIITKGGERTIYRFAFYLWNCEYIRPNRKIIAKSSGFQNMFAQNIKLKKVEKEYFDLSQHSVNTDNANYMFLSCEALEVIEDIGMPVMTGYYGTFQAAMKLRTIEILRVGVDTILTDTFRNCYSLENITIEGVIGKAINTQWATRLSKASIVNIINALSTTASGLTATFSKTAVNKAFETESGANDGTNSTEWLALRETKSNWTISLV